MLSSGWSPPSKNASRKHLNALSREITNAKNNDGSKSGSVMQRSFCHAPAPSKDAAL